VEEFSVRMHCSNWGKKPAPVPLYSTHLSQNEGDRNRMTMARILHLTEICNPSITLGVKFQLLTGTDGF